MELTEDDIEINNVGASESAFDIQITIGYEKDNVEGKKHLEEIKQQILENQEKLEKIQEAYGNIHFTDDGEVFQNKVKKILGMK